MLFIFDMGNVVCTSVDILPGLSKRLGISIEVLRRECADDFFGLTTGAITTEAFWRIFEERFEVTAAEDYLATLFTPRLEPSMAALLQLLKRQGCRCVCGTNTIESHFRIHQERGDYQLFDEIYASHRMGAAKPDPRFFQLILAAEGRGERPESVLFIDDLEENVAAARNLGLGAHRFTGPGPLCGLLSGYGIECYPEGVSPLVEGGVS